MIPPRSGAERVVYAQAYETLVRVTCEGQLAASLAERWTGDSSGRVWTLTIRSDATFWDGGPVTADGVASVWRQRRTDLGASAGHIGDAVERVTIAGGREITVHFRDVHRDGPRPLADPWFAIARPPGPLSSHHAGTGPYRFRELDEPAGVASGNPPPIILGPDDAAAGPVLLLRTMRSPDARDFIDRGVDVLVTSDRRVTDYAATRPELQVRPLQPDRVYVLLSTARFGANAPSLVADDDGRWAPLRASLARDVIRTNAPPPTGRWWGGEAEIGACGVSGSASSGPIRSSGTRRLVYPVVDPVAGDLARRLVALAADASAASETTVRAPFPEPSLTGADRVVAAGLSDVELSASVMKGSDLAYLVALPRRPLDPCGAWRDLTARAPWVSSGVASLVAEAGPTLITGPGAPALVVEGDNSVRVVTRPPPTRDRR